MKVVIIEDEEPAVEVLLDSILSLRPEGKILGTPGSIKEAVRWFENNPAPDLIFCDIHLPDGNSFEIFKRVEVKTPVIFTTAYDQYAIEAFKVNSIDYLLKPIMKEDVSKAITKFENLQKDQLVQKWQNMQHMIGNHSVSGSHTRKRFVVKQGQNMKTISIDEVAGFLAEEGLVFLYNFNGQRFMINSTLDQVEGELDPSKFFRLNRQFIVNIDAIDQVKPYFKTRLIVRTRPPLILEQTVSTNRVSDFKKWLDS